MAESWVLFVTDIVVSKNFQEDPSSDDVEIFTLNSQGERICLLGRGYSPRLVLRLLRPCTPSELDTLKSVECIKKHCANEIPKQTHLEKLRYFECDVAGNRLKYPFLELKCRSKKDWKSMSSKKCVDQIDKKLRNVGNGVAGNHDDGPYYEGYDTKRRMGADGRVCNQQEGRGLYELSHDFMRQTGIKASRWHEFKVQPTSGGAICNVYDTGAVSVLADTTLPTLPLEAWDIEVVNSLSVNFGDDNWYISPQLIRMRETQFITDIFAENKVSVEDNSWIDILCPRLSQGTHLRFKNSDKQVKIAYLCDNHHRILHVAPDGHFIVTLQQNGGAKLQIGGVSNSLNYLQSLQREIVFYFKHWDTEYNVQSLKALKCFLGSHHGEYNTENFEFKLVICDRNKHKTASLDKSSGTDDVEVCAHLLNLGTDLEFESNFCLKNEGSARKQKSRMRETLRYNGIASPNEPLNSVVNICVAECLFPSATLTRATVFLLNEREQYATSGWPDECKICVTPSEVDMLREYLTNVQTSESIFSVGYNTFGFDIPYIYTRCQMLMTPKEISALYMNAYEGRPFCRQVKTAQGEYEYFTMQTRNRFEVDLIAWFRQVGRTPPTENLKLDTVSKYFLGGESKHDISFTDINRKWFISDDETVEFQQKVALYCLQDSVLCLKLALSERVNAITFNILLSKSMNNLLRLTPINNVGQLEMQNAYYYSECHKRGIVVDPPTKRDVEESLNNKPQGAMVFLPVARQDTGFVHGLWEPVVSNYAPQRLVFTLDFLSLYPSIMRSLNLCYSTRIRLGYVCEELLTKPRSVDSLSIVAQMAGGPSRYETLTVRHTGATATVLPPHVFDWAVTIDSTGDKATLSHNTKNHTITIAADREPQVRCAVHVVIPGRIRLAVSDPETSLMAVWMADPRVFVGVVPTCLLNIHKDRRATKKKMKNLKENEQHLYPILDCEQMSLKVMMNAQYGVTGCKTHFCMLAFTAAVTFFGRNLLEQAKNQAEGMGRSLNVYGDTDSVFVTPTEALAVEIFWKAVQRMPPGTIDLAALKQSNPLEYDTERGSAYFSSVLPPGSGNEGSRDAEQLRRRELQLQLHKFFVQEMYDYYLQHAELQTTLFEPWRDPSQEPIVVLELENIFFLSEFWENKKKNYIALASETPDSEPRIYFKGLAMKRSTCCGLDANLQRQMYSAKFTPALLAHELGVNHTELTGDAIYSLTMLAVLQLWESYFKPSYDDSFYDALERDFSIKKRYKKPTAYKNPAAQPAVQAHEKMEAVDTSMACAVGDFQKYVAVRGSVGSGLHVNDPLVLRTNRLGRTLDIDYYVEQCWKSLKGSVRAKTKNRPSSLQPGDMNIGTYVTMKPIFKILQGSFNQHKGQASLFPGNPSDKALKALRAGGIQKRKNEFYTQEFWADKKPKK